MSEFVVPDRQRAGPSFRRWLQSIEIAVAGPLIVSDFPAALDAAIEGMGIAQLPEPLAAVGLESGKLICVLEAYAPVMPGLFLCYPGRRQIMPKLRAFIDHVKGRAEGGKNAWVQAGATHTRSRTR